VTTHESERDFGGITMLFSIAPLSAVQLENSGVMSLKFCSNSCVITNPYFVGHSWMRLELILSLKIYIGS
jgi:hypothetical protein